MFNKKNVWPDSPLHSLYEKSTQIFVCHVLFFTRTMDNCHMAVTVAVKHLSSDLYWITAVVVSEEGCPVIWVMILYVTAYSSPPMVNGIKTTQTTALFSTKCNSSLSTIPQEHGILHFTWGNSAASWLQKHNWQIFRIKLPPFDAVPVEKDDQSHRGWTRHSQTLLRI